MKLLSAIVSAVLLVSGACVAQKQWTLQPTIPASVPRILGVSMFDTSRGVAVGEAQLGANPAITGVMVKNPGSPTWFEVDPAQFTPALTMGFAFFSGVHAVPGTSTCYIGGALLQGGVNSLYRSDDFGHTWVLHNTGMGMSFGIYDIDFRSSTEGMVVGTGGHQYYTSDGGATWPVPFVVAPQNLHAIKHVPGTQDWWIVGENKTVVRLTWPPGSWVQYVASFPGNATDHLEGLSVVDANTVFFGVNTNVVGIAATPGLFTTLPPITPTPSTLYAVWFFDANNGWAAGAYNELYRTTNCGVNWSRYSAVPAGGGAGLVARMVFPDTGCGYAVGPYAGGAGWILRYGDATYGDIGTSDTLADFGAVACGPTADIVVTIANTGADTLRIGARGIALPPGFTLSPPNTPLRIAPGASQPVIVRWTPAADRPDTIPAGSFMVVTSDDPLHPQWSIRLSGIRHFSRLTPARTTLVFTAACVGDRIDLSVPATVAGDVPPTLIAWARVSGDDDVALVAPATGSAVNSPVDLVFRFTPGAAGARAGGYLLIAGNPACPDSIAFTFTGTGTVPTVVVHDSLTDFGVTCPGIPVDRRILVVNTGPDSLVIDALDFESGADLFQCVTPLPAPFGYSDSLRLTLRFAPGPTDAGTFTGRYRLKFHAGAGTCTGEAIVTLTGVSAKADIAITPNPATLANVPIGTADSTIITVINTGTGPVHLTGVTLTNAPVSLTKTGVPAMPFTMAPGGSVQFVLHYTPLKAETLIVTMNILFDAPCTGVTSGLLTLTSTPPPGYSAAASRDLATLACGDRMLDTIMVRNTGEGPLILRGFDITGPQRTAFTIVEPTPPVAIATGDSLAVVVEFAPVTTGPGVATLTIRHNDPRTNFAGTVALRGVYAPVGVEVAGDTVTPVTSCVHAAGTRRLRIRNTGMMPVTLTSAVVTQGAPEFAVVAPVPPATIAAGDSLDCVVRFTPSVAGPRIGRVTLGFNPCDRSLVFTVAGVGVAQPPLVTPSRVDFGMVRTGTDSMMTARIANPGPLPMTVTGVSVIPATPGLALRGVPTPPFDVAVGAGLTVDLEYAPTVPGTLANVRLCVEIGAPCSDVACIDVMGGARGDGLALDRGAMNFALDPCGMASACDTVRIVNNASVPRTVSSVAIDQSGDVFGIAGGIATPMVVPAGGSVLVTICASPAFTGSAAGRLVVLSDDTHNPRLEMAIAATRDSVHVEIAEPMTDFGGLAPCTPVRDMTVTVRNTGTVDDTLLDASTPAAPFRVVTAMPVALAAGVTTQLTVRFAPVAEGAYNDTIWISTQRCGTRIAVACRGSYFETSVAAVPTSLMFSGVNIGSGVTRNVLLANIHRVPARIARIEVVPAGPFTSLTATPAALDSGTSALFGFRFAPSAPGAAAATALVIMDLPCADTIAIALEGTGVDNGIVFRGAQLDFGAAAQCETLERVDTLVNTGVAMCTLTGSVVTGPDAGLFTVVNPVTADEVLAGGASRLFTVRFAPGAGTDGGAAATLSVSTRYSAQPTIDLALDGVRRMQRTPADQAVSAGAATIGVESRVPVTLTNAGADSLTYTAADLPPGMTCAPMPPITVPAGGTVQVLAGVTPVQAGPFALTATLRTMRPCADSTRITVTGTAGGGSHLTAANFGATPLCLQSKRVVMFRNGEGAGVAITGVAAAGGDSANFAIVAPTVFPIAVAEDDSVAITVAFNPDTAPETYVSECVATIRWNGMDREVRSPLTGATAVSRLTATTLPLDAGQTRVGKPVRAQVELVNPAPFVLTIDSVHLFAMTLKGTAPAMPAMIPPGGSLVIEVEWTPVVEGVLTDSLVVFTARPCEDRAAYAIEGFALPPDLVHTDLAIPVLEGRVDDHVLIPVTSAQDLGGAAARSWSGAITFNRTMLWPLGVVTANTLSRDMTVTSSYDHTTGTLRMTAAGAMLRSGTGVMVYIEALVLLGNALETPLTLAPAFDFTSGRAQVRSRANGEFHLVGYCMGDGNRLIRIEGMYGLQQNHPNPAAPETEIGYEIAIDGPVRLAVYDALGREVAVLVDASLTAGKHTAHFNAAGRAPGVYFYRLTSGKYRETRRMMVGR